MKSRSSTPARLPDFVEPMKAKLVGSMPPGGTWIYETSAIPAVQICPKPKLYTWPCSVVRRGKVYRRGVRSDSPRVVTVTERFAFLNCLDRILNARGVLRTRLVRQVIARLGLKSEDCVERKNDEPGEPHQYQSSGPPATAIDQSTLSQASCDMALIDEQQTSPRVPGSR